MEETSKPFGTLLRSDIGFLPWVAQQIGAPLLPLMWALLTANVPPMLANYAGTYVGQPLEIAIEILWSFLIGWVLVVALALLVKGLFPSAVASGKRVWILPVALFALGLIWDSTLFSFPKALASLFYYGAEGEASLGFSLITFPTCSCVLYSIAMASGTRKRLANP